jgi:hypothetical protein
MENLQTTKVMDESSQTTKVMDESSQEELKLELMKQMEQKRVACLQELGATITPILAKHNMILDIVVTLDSKGMRTALNVIPKQG